MYNNPNGDVTSKPGQVLSMQEAMEYLTAHGFACKSRSTLYRMLEDFNIHYININPSGKNEIRRFPLASLNKFLIEQGITPLRGHDED